MKAQTNCGKGKEIYAIYSSLVVDPAPNWGAAGMALQHGLGLLSQRWAGIDPVYRSIGRFPAITTSL